MKLIFGAIFKMKRVTYNGKTESVYRYEALDIGGYLRNSRGIYVYHFFHLNLGELFYVICVIAIER